jgi:predicted YcjX-like family ATPase
VTPVLDDTVDALRSLVDYAAGTVRPTVRLGVTGLARSGKTVFTAALVHHLLAVTPLPVFRAAAEGRIRKARLVPQPDDAVPRFPYEEHMAALDARRWPDSTKRIAELRVEIDYERAHGWRKGPATLDVDLVDYPGEWLLDLSLMDMSFRDWSVEIIAASRRPDRATVAAEWRERLKGLRAADRADEVVAADVSEVFRAYLTALRAHPERIATMPPGRFLMPGDLAGSPALTFAPLDLRPDEEVAPGSLGALMERRFEAYRSHIVRPFFREHFARLDRQIVLVDVLAALDAGPDALADLESALDRVLLAFRAGRNSLISRLFRPRIDRVLFAATKADHLHQSGHQRLEAILRLLVERAVRRTEGAGAKVATVALASIRATHEVSVREGGVKLAAIAGTPEAGETIGDETFAGNTDAAVFPGELPEDPKAIFAGAVPPGSLRFPRFRPPPRKADAAGRPSVLPHIRLDRALEFLLGDRLA